MLVSTKKTWLFKEFSSGLKKSVREMKNFAQNGTDAVSKSWFSKQTLRSNPLMNQEDSQCTDTAEGSLGWDNDSVFGIIHPDCSRRPEKITCFKLWESQRPIPTVYVMVGMWSQASL